MIGWMNENLIHPEVVIDIKGISSLKKLSFRKNILQIGALVTMSQILESAIVRRHYPMMREMARLLACTGIRNRATAVGNICSAVPCCDNGPVLMVYDAIVHVEAITGQRDIPILDWFRGPRTTALAANELVTGITIPKPQASHAGCFAKLKRYRGEDLAQASVAVLVVEPLVYKISFGSVAPTPVRALRMESMMNGNPLTDELLDDASRLIEEETSPITDIRSTKEYRAKMLKTLFRRAMRVAESRLAGRGPDYGINAIE